MQNAAPERSTRMDSTRGTRLVAVVIFVLVACFCAQAGKEFVMPAAQPAHSYPARDEHPMDKVTVAVDPYDVEDKASIFSVNYRNNGYLPIFLVITNDGNEPVSLVDMKPELNTKDRSKLYPGTMDDLARRLSHPARNDRQNTLPIPLPKKETKGGLPRKTWDEIEQAQFVAKAVEPHSTASGFLFFDVSGISNPLPGATFYLMGTRDNKGTELIYFEVPMEKYLSAPEVNQK